MSTMDDYLGRRDEAIKQLTLTQKIEICKDNDLLTDELLADLIYNSDVSLKDLEEVYGTF